MQGIALQLKPLPLMICVQFLWRVGQGGRDRDNRTARASKGRGCAAAMKLHAGGNDEQLGYVASAHDVSVDATWAWAGGATEALFDSQLVRTKLGSDTNISTCNWLWAADLIWLGAPVAAVASWTTADVLQCCHAAMKLHSGGSDEQLGYVASAHDVSVDAMAQADLNQQGW